MSHNLGYHISENMQVEKVMFSLFVPVREKVITIETTFKIEDLKFYKLVGDLHAFEIHHLLPKKGIATANKGKNLTLMST